MNLDVRFGSKHDPKEFVRPDELEVQKILARLPEGAEELRVRYCWDWVCRNVGYPLDAQGHPTDRHVLEAFVVARPVFLGTRYRVTKVTEEFWQYPHETAAWGWGDCEDTSILLCSLLRNFIPPERVSVVGGDAGRWNHAWVQVDDKILETTLTSAPPPSEHYRHNQYRPRWAFNDKIVCGDVVLGPRGDERAKLRWIAACWQRPTKL